MCNIPARQGSYRNAFGVALFFKELIHGQPGLIQAGQFKLLLVKTARIIGSSMLDAGYGLAMGRAAQRR